MTTERRQSSQHRTLGRSDRPPRVVVAIPTDGRIHARTLESVREMIAATPQAEVELWWNQDVPHDRCRNGLVRRFLAESDWTHLLFIDNDTIVPVDGLELLLAARAPLTCGPTPILMRRHDVNSPTPAFGVTTNLMVLQDERRRGQVVDLHDASLRYVVLDPDEFPDQPFECDASGMSCCLIERRVLEAIDAPWFRFVGDEPGARLGEDVYFFRKARRHGFRLTAHPGVMCDHLKDVDLTHLDSLFSDDPPQPLWRPVLPDDVPQTLVVAGAPGGWLKSPVAGVLQDWSARWPRRVRIHTIDPGAAGPPGSLLLALDSDPIVRETDATHILLLEADVVPDSDTLPILAGVAQPIVSAMTRTLIDGTIRWAFWLRDRQTDQVHAPQNLRLASLDRPFEAVGVDTAALLVERWALTPLAQIAARARKSRCDGTTVTRQWIEQSEELTGYRPFVAPHLVRRDAEAGLLGLLDMKMRFRARLRESGRGAARPQPAEPVAMA